MMAMITLTAPTPPVGEPRNWTWELPTGRWRPGSKPAVAMWKSGAKADLPAERMTPGGLNSEAGILPEDFIKMEEVNFILQETVPSPTTILGGMWQWSGIATAI